MEVKMKKKVLIVFALFLVFNVVTVYASTALYGYFEGFERVKIIANGKEVNSEIPGFIIDSTTVLPLRAISEAFGVIVTWDKENKVATLIKPNVNMQLTANKISYENEVGYIIYSPFGKIPKNQRYKFSFSVYSEIDNLPHEQVQLKLVLRDPDGEIIKESVEPQSFDAIEENSLQYIDNTSFRDITFMKDGNYSVEVLLKSESTFYKFTKIGEKLILVK